MSEYLTPDDLDRFIELSDLYPKEVAALREYAAIVEAVATDNPLNMRPDRYGDYDPECWYCGAEARNVRQEQSSKYPQTVWMVADFDHAPDCFYLRARRVRGYE
jgi:hypothetical protein